MTRQINTEVLIFLGFMIPKQVDNNLIIDIDLPGRKEIPVTPERLSGIIRLHACMIKFFRYCDANPVTRVGETKELTFSFITDWNVTARGFRARYSFGQLYSITFIHRHASINHNNVVTNKFHKGPSPQQSTFNCKHN